MKAQTQMAAYERFCRERQHRPLKSVKGHHIHHVLPRALGGDDSPSNLVLLTHEEHYIAHRMLFQAMPKEPKAAAAFIIMVNMTKEITGDGFAPGDARLYARAVKVAEPLVLSAAQKSGSLAMVNGTGVFGLNAEERRSRSIESNKARELNPITKFNNIASVHGDDVAAAKCRDKFGDVFSHEVHAAALVYRRTYEVAKSANRSVGNRLRQAWDAVLATNPAVVLNWCFSPNAMQSAAIRSFLMQHGNERQRSMVAKFKGW